MRLPLPRGERSAWVSDLLQQPVGSVGAPAAPAHADRADDALALWVLHELHYRGFDEVDDAWEWSPLTLSLRADLERRLEDDLRSGWAAVRPGTSDDVAASILDLIAADDGPSLARHVQQHATREEAESLLRQRSIYHLKEADPTSWVVPRLSAPAKAALVEIQFDEYGAGDASRLHHELFARGLAASGLDAEYGAYIDETCTEVLEQNNALSMFGLHRRLRGAALGHFAVFESTSSIPSRQLAQGLRRLGLAEEMASYYDEHVEADAVHEQLALRDICAVLVAEEPALADDVLFGAWACLELEKRTATALMTQWERTWPRSA